MYRYPVFVFNDESGQTRKIHSSHGSNPARYYEGEKVAVYFLGSTGFYV